MQDELRRHMDQALEMLAPAAGVAQRREIAAEVITTLSVGMTHQQLMRPDADLGCVVRGVQDALDRELTVLIAASEAALTDELTETKAKQRQ